MNTYYSTFISGCQKIIEKELKNKPINASVILLLDGLVIFDTNASAEEIKNIRFLNNSFLLYKYYKGDYSIKSLIGKAFLQKDIFRKVILKNVKTVRLIFSKENQLVGIDKNKLTDLEKLISKILNLKVDRTSPDTEVWFQTRSEGYAFIGLRLTKKPNYEKTLHKGELRPELSHVLCLVADIKPSDIILDPFAGYGSIPIECAKSFKFKKLLVGEKDRNVFKILQAKIKKITNIILKNWDGLNLTSISDNSIDKIVTDPPWGMYENKNFDIESFYTKMLKEFSRVLKPNGITVVLTAQKDLFEKLIDKSKVFKTLNKYDILVSGKKAGIYKIKSIR